MNTIGLKLKSVLFLTLISLFTISCNSGEEKEQYLLVGTYTNSGSKGIYVYKMNMETGALSEVSTTETENPSFLAIHGDYVFAVNETGGEGGGNISSFKFDKENGTLTPINQVPSGGADPCYIAVSDNGKWVSVANYSGGSVAIFPVEDGKLKPFVQLVQHNGRGADSVRQEKPHVHTTVFSPDSKYLLATDLGLDKLYVYEITNNENEPLAAAATPFVNTGTASGPRHIAFSPNDKNVYLINELNGMVIAYDYDNGHLNEIQQIELSDKGQRENMDGAEIRVSPDGNFLYASSRNDVNTLSIYSVDKSTGKLQRVGTQSVYGDHPRNFTIDEDGKFLIVANKNSNNIVVFNRNEETGEVTKSNVEINLPQPVCVRLVPMK